MKVNKPAKAIAFRRKQIASYVTPVGPITIIQEEPALFYVFHFAKPTGTRKTKRGAIYLAEKSFHNAIDKRIKEKKDEIAALESLTQLSKFELTN